MDIKQLGFDKWFSDRVDSERSPAYEIARVTAVSKESALVSNSRINVFAEMSGKLMFSAQSSLDYPTVGDWVYAQFFDNGSFAVIHEIIPRRSLLKRKTSGKKIDFQLIASNIDTAFIIQSFGSDYSIRRLERYLVMVNEGGITPVVLLSKSDLATSQEIESSMEQIHKLMPDIEIITFSSKNGSGMEKIEKLMAPGKTFCLLGSSGVGKTTLLNSLVSEELFETQEVREKDGKGRHTTTRRQLITLKNGAMVIDTPGMRELGNFATETGLTDTFSEIAQLSEECFYKNCTHTSEKGCAILLALKGGALSEERYQNYVKMERESAYNEMSYLQKRERDREFGKLCKSVIKSKKNRK